MQFGRLALQLCDARSHPLGAPIDLQQSNRFARAKIADVLGDAFQPRVHQCLQYAQFRGASDLIAECTHLQHDGVVVRLCVFKAAAVGVIRIG